MKKNLLYLSILGVMLVILIIGGVAFFLPQVKKTAIDQVYGQSSTAAIQLYTAQHPNPAGTEVYSCRDNPGDSIAVRTACSPSWTGTLSDGRSCSDLRISYDGQNEPSGSPGYCTSTPPPFLDTTSSQPFIYNDSMCQNGSEIVLAAKNDPSTCTSTSTDPACFFYIDNKAVLTACKQGGGCVDSSNITSPGVNGHPAPIPSQNLCPLFQNQGAGTYSIRMRLYDSGGGVMYGSSNIWLATFNATPAPAWIQGLGGDVYSAGSINVNKAPGW